MSKAFDRILRKQQAGAPAPAADGGGGGGGSTGSGAGGAASPPPPPRVVMGYMLASRTNELLGWPLDSFLAREVDLARRFMDGCAGVLHHYVAAVMECDHDILFFNALGSAAFKWVLPDAPVRDEAGPSAVGSAHYAATNAAQTYCIAMPYKINEVRGALSVSCLLYSVSQLLAPSLSHTGALCPCRRRRARA